MTPVTISVQFASAGVVQVNVSLSGPGGFSKSYNITKDNTSPPINLADGVYTIAVIGNSGADVTLAVNNGAALLVQDTCNAGLIVINDAFTIGI